MSIPSTELTAAEGPYRGAWFQTTHWSVVLGLNQTHPGKAAASLSALCQAYWYPLYTFIRRSGHGPEDAKDLTQAFFARVAERNFLQSLGTGKGKFRSFLLVALKRFLANERDRAQALKRGGNQQIISLDEVDTENRYLAEPVDQLSPDKLFDRRWALTLLDQVMTRLEKEAIGAGKARLFGELKELLSGEAERSAYAVIAERLAMSEGALRTTVHRLRRRYRELLREEIAHTVECPEDIDDEIRQLFAALT